MKAFLEGQQCGTPGPECTRTGRSRRVRVSMRGIFRGKIFFFQKSDRYVEMFLKDGL